MPDEPNLQGSKPLPLCVATYFQPHGEPRLPVPGGGRTRPGCRYLIARMAEGEPPVIHSGHFRTAYEVEQALKAAAVQPAAKAREAPDA